MMRLRALAVLLVAVAWAVPGSADQNDRRLDGLFERLQATRDAAEAAEIQNRIWALWFTAEDRKVTMLMGVGSMAMNQGQYQPALEAFNRVVAMAPDFAEGWNRRATLYYLMGDYPASVSDIAKTLALEPRHFGALSGLGLINMRLGRTDQAIKAFRDALAVNPHSTGAKANLDSLLGERT